MDTNTLFVILAIILAALIVAIEYSKHIDRQKKETPPPAPQDKFPINTEYPVEPYFKVGGVTFYKFVDSSNLPAGRSLASLKYFMQLKTNCDDAFLHHLERAWDASLKANPINLEHQFELKNMLRDRLSWAFHPAIIFRYASVMYMQEGENPATYDEVFNDRKIEFWKAHASAESFFLAEPFLNLMPYSKDVVGYVPKYSLAVVEADLLHHRKVLQLLLSLTTSSEDVSSLSSQITTLEMLRDYVGNPQMNILSSSNSDIQLLKND